MTHDKMVSLDSLNTSAIIIAFNLHFRNIVIAFMQTYFFNVSDASKLAPEKARSSGHLKVVVNLHFICIAYMMRVPQRLVSELKQCVTKNLKYCPWFEEQSKLTFWYSVWQLTVTRMKNIFFFIPFEAQAYLLILFYA